MRPEVELVLDCARSRVAVEGGVRIPTGVEASLDWPWVLSLVRRHRLTPLLYCQFKNALPAAIPGQFLEELQREFQANTRHNLLLAGELLKLLDGLKRIGVDAMPLKGPVLALTAYGSLALRQFIDLDIVVRPADLLRAKEVLVAQGYHSVNAFTPTEEQALPESGNHTYNFLRVDGQVSVEIHWAISQREYSFPLNFETLWRDRREVPFLGTLVPAPSPELLLLILCAHGTKHYWERLMWVCDVAELIHSRPDLDWDRLWEQARALRSERMLLVGLCLVNQLLKVPLPPEATHRIQADTTTGLLSSKAAGWLFLERENLGVTVQKRFFIFQVRECWRDKLVYAGHLLVWSITPNERDQAFVSMPAACSFLYYLVRPVRLLVKGVGRRRKLPVGAGV